MDGGACFQQAPINDSDSTRNALAVFLTRLVHLWRGVST